MTAARSTLWRHPEWSAASLVFVAWSLALVWFHDPMPTPVDTQSMPGMVMPMQATLGMPIRSWATPLVSWLAMATAMMIPAALPTIRHLALSSLWRRRQTTIGLFVVGHLAVWTLFGVAAFTLANIVSHLVQPRIAIAAAVILVVGAAWEYSRLRATALRACHLLQPMPIRGRAADRAALAAGARHARWCAVGCWPIMLAIAVDMNLAFWLMLILTAAVVTRSVSRRPRRLRSHTAAALVAVAAMLVI